MAENRSDDQGAALSLGLFWCFCSYQWHERPQEATGKTCTDSPHMLFFITGNSILRLYQGDSYHGSVKNPLRVGHCRWVHAVFVG